MVLEDKEGIDSKINLDPGLSRENNFTSVHSDTDHRVVDEQPQEDINNQHQMEDPSQNLPHSLPQSQDSQQQVTQQGQQPVTVLDQPSQQQQFIQQEQNEQISLQDQKSQQREPDDPSQPLSKEGVQDQQPPVEDHQYQHDSPEESKDEIRKDAEMKDIEYNVKDSQNERNVQNETKEDNDNDNDNDETKDEGEPEVEGEGEDEAEDESGEGSTRCVCGSKG